MSGHTPGPWHVEAVWVAPLTKRGGHDISYGVNGYRDGPEGDVCRTIGTSEADARLIAAAPDLLVLAEIFLGGDERYQVAVGGNPIAVDKMLADARATIAKAKGTP